MARLSWSLDEIGRARARRIRAQPRAVIVVGDLQARLRLVQHSSLILRAPALVAAAFMAAHLL
jgi:hypothetical protein